MATSITKIKFRNMKKKIKEVNYKELCEVYEKLIYKKNTYISRLTELRASSVSDYLEEYIKNLEIESELIDLKYKVAQIKIDRTFLIVALVVSIIVMLIK